MPLSKSPLTWNAVFAISCVLCLFAPRAHGELTSAEVAELLASDGSSGDRFGRAVAIQGDIAVIGAPFNVDGGTDRGVAYVFERDARGTWQEQARLLPSDFNSAEVLGPITGKQFGTSVSLDGDTIAIGARLRDVDDFTVGQQQGAVYLFVRDDSGVWSEQDLVFINSAAFKLGTSVALLGDTLVAGAPGGNTNGILSGASYVFVRDANGSWSQQAMLVPGDNAAQDQFGQSVAIGVDTVVVGAPSDDDMAVNAGSAYVFTRTNGIWTEQVELHGSDATFGSQFGESLAFDQDTLLVGAPGAGPADAGAAYVFRRNDANGWDEVAILAAEDGALSDFFGVSVALHSGVALVGSERNDESATNSGAAYLFQFESGSWTPGEKLLAGDGAPSERFGSSVALCGNDVFVGAEYGDELAAGVNSGSAYVFSLDGFVAVGGGLAGVSGVPSLDGSGTLQPRTPYTLSLSGAAPSATAFRITGFSKLNAPLLGGLLVPFPDSVVTVATNGLGELTTTDVIPLGLPTGTTVVFQYFIADSRGAAGFSASEGLVATSR